MMKKKLFAFLTSLACMAGCIPVSVFAADPWDEGALYRVLESDEYGMLLEQLDGHTYTLSKCGADMDAIWAEQEMAKAGDIIRLSAPEEIAEISPACLHYSEENPAVLENLGSAENICKRVPLTVTEENNYSYTLTDEAGNLYSYRDNTSLLVEAKAGTVIDFLVYEGYAVLPEPTGRFSTFIVVAADQPEAPEHYVLYKPGCGTFYVSEKTLAEYLTEERIFVCGDILRCYTKTSGISEEETGNLYFHLDGTGSEVLYAGSIYDDPQMAEFTVVTRRQTLHYIKLENNGENYLHIVDYLKYTDGIWMGVKRSYTQSCDLDILSLREGDKVTMLTYEGQPVLPYSVAPLGDINTDGALNILDVIIINRRILGAEETPARAVDALGQADFNGNGKIDADDSLGMLRRIVGLEA